MTRIIIKPITLQSHRDTFNFYAIGDIHKGFRGFENKAYQEALKIIQNDESDKYVVWMGDYVNHFPKGDYRGDKREIDECFPDVLSAYTSIREDVKPLIKNTLCILEGNHDLDWFKAEEQDYIAWLCTELGVPFAKQNVDSPYGTYEAYIRLKIKRENSLKSRRNIDIVCWHGMGGSRTKGGKVNVLEKPAQCFPLASIYLMGHLHCHGIIMDNILSINEKIRDIVDIDRYFAFTGGFLKGYPPDFSNYVSRKMLPPLGIGALKLEIQPFAKVGNTDKLCVKWEKIP